MYDLVLTHSDYTVGSSCLYGGYVHGVRNHPVITPSDYDGTVSDWTLNSGLEFPRTLRSEKRRFFPRNLPKSKKAQINLRS